MKNHLHAIIALLLAAWFLPGCSMLTHDGRQQAAYARYVRKSSQGRVKQQRLFHSNKPAMPVTESTEPTVAVESSGPQAVGENVP